MLPGDFTVTLNLAPEVRRKLISQVRDAGAVRHHLGLIRQRQMAQLLRNNPHLCTGRGELRQNMILDDTQWQAFMEVYGQRCWSDPDFRPWLQKQDAHRDLFVPDKGTKIQSGYTGRGDSRRTEPHRAGGNLPLGYENKTNDENHTTHNLARAAGVAGGGAKSFLPHE